MLCICELIHSYSSAYNFSATRTVFALISIISVIILSVFFIINSLKTQKQKKNMLVFVNTAVK